MGVPEALVPYHELGLVDPNDIRDLALVLGPAALATVEAALAEAKADKVGMVLIPSDPVGKSRAGYIRSLAQGYDRLLVSVYPGALPFEVAVEVVRASLPDVEQRLQLAPIQGNRLFDAVKHPSFDQGSPIEVHADPSLGFEQERSTKGIGIDPTLIRVIEEPYPPEDIEAIRRAFEQPTQVQAKQLLDPHVFSDPERVQRVRSALGEALRLEFLRDISPNDDREEGASLIEDIVGRYQALLAKRGINIQGMKFLGKGNNGLAWELSDKRVLKVTTDDAEASVAVHLKGKDLKHVFQVHDVWAFPGQYNGHHVYGLVTEAGLTKPAEQERRDFQYMIENLYADRDDEYATAIDERLRDLLESGNLRAVLDDFMAANYPPEVKRKTLQLVKRFDLPGICADAKRLGIAFDLHGGNIMRRGDQYVIIDIGTGGDQEAAKPPFVEDRLDEVGITAGPEGNMRGLNRRDGGNQSAWSAGAAALRKPVKHVPDDENSNYRPEYGYQGNKLP